MVLNGGVVVLVLVLVAFTEGLRHLGGPRLGVKQRASQFKVHMADTTHACNEEKKSW